MERHHGDNGSDLYDAAGEQGHGEQPQRPEQEHPVQEAHGGSMAPGLVDDTGHLTGDPPSGAG